MLGVGMVPGVAPGFRPGSFGGRWQCRGCGGGWALAGCFGADDGTGAWPVVLSERAGAGGCVGGVSEDGIRTVRFDRSGRAEWLRWLAG